MIRVFVTVNSVIIGYQLFDS